MTEFLRRYDALYLIISISVPSKICFTLYLFYYCIIYILLMKWLNISIVRIDRILSLNIESNFLIGSPVIRFKHQQLQCIYMKQWINVCHTLSRMHMHKGNSMQQWQQFFVNILQIKRVWYFWERKKLFKISIFTVCLKISEIYKFAISLNICE